MKALASILKKTWIVFCFVTTTTHATTKTTVEETQIEEKEYAQVGTEEPSEEEKQAQVEHREKEKVANDENESGRFSNNAAGYSIFHPGTFHFPVHVSTVMGSVELEDGSLWDVASYDQYKTYSWLTSDTLIITPNLSYTAGRYYFQIVNQSSGDLVDVNITRGPLLGGYYSHRIIGFDDMNRCIYLDDGTRWTISSYDMPMTKYWLSNDTVIIGVNTFADAPYLPNILINVRKLNYVCGFAN
jgi:hypothetical protein